MKLTIPQIAIVVYLVGICCCIINDRTTGIMTPEVVKLIQ